MDRHRRFAATDRDYVGIGRLTIEIYLPEAILVSTGSSNIPVIIKIRGSDSAVASGIGRGNKTDIGEMAIVQAPFYSKALVILFLVGSPFQPNIPVVLHSLERGKYDREDARRVGNDRAVAVTGGVVGAYPPYDPGLWIRELEGKGAGRRKIVVIETIIHNDIAAAGRGGAGRAKGDGSDRGGRGRQPYFSDRIGLQRRGSPRIAELEIAGLTPGGQCGIGCCVKVGGYGASGSGARSGLTVAVGPRGHAGAGSGTL